MKKIVSNSDVAHLFAHQSQIEAKNPNGSFYFYGKSLYSYGSHFCIAKFIGEQTLLFTERGYSNTTAKHISLSESATSHLEKIYCAYPNKEHADNFNFWLIKAENTAQNLKTARKPEKYISELHNIRARAEKYATFFGIEVPLTLAQVLSVTEKAEIATYFEQKHAILEAEKKRKEKEQAKAHKEALSKWRKFEQRSLYLRNGFDYLRKDAETLETSQGVKLPLEVAERYYKQLNALKVGDKILNYTISEINKAFIAIGCHKISLKEIESVMK